MVLHFLMSVGFSINLKWHRFPSVKIIAGGKITIKYSYTFLLTKGITWIFGAYISLSFFSFFSSSLDNCFENAHDKIFTHFSLLAVFISLQLPFKSCSPRYINSYQAQIVTLKQKKTFHSSCPLALFSMVWKNHSVNLLNWFAADWLSSWSLRSKIYI